MASCMADNGLTGPCIGLVWDGTGLGTDGTSWGAECMAGDYERFTRLGSILPIPLIGGDRAVKEPYRVAFALLRAAGCETDGIRDGAYLEKQLSAGLNCPLSSGMGRLFDGAASILGIKEVCNYEGQAAILLEAAAGENGECFPICFLPDEQENKLLRFDWRPMIRALAAERQAGTAVPILAAKFMNTLIDMAAEQAAEAAEKTGIRQVVLSGGSFQNQYVMHRLPDRLKTRGLEVYHHRRVSCNDEGLSLGQLMIGNARKE